MIVDPKHGLHRNQILAGVREAEMGVQEFMIGSTLLKDPKCRPERELRIVAIPGTGKLNAIAMREYPHVFKPLPLPLSPVGSAARTVLAALLAKGET